VFRSQVVRVAEARGAAPTWTYEFSWPSPTRTWALHCLDLPFWFDSLEADGVSAIAGDDPPQALADEIHGAALSLARTGKLGWTPWSRQPGSTRVFGAPGSAPEVAEEGFASTRALI
jgi:para-nitrobenzyl esterase